MSVSEKEIKSLHEYLEEQEQVTDRFKVQDDEQANWALRKIARVDEKLAESRETAKKEIDKVKTWLEQTEKQLNSEREYFEGLLLEYALEMGLDKAKKRSKALPNGRFRFKKQGEDWRIDNDVVISQLESLGLDHLIKVEKKPKKAEIKKEVKVHNGKAVHAESGELIEGITVIDKGKKFEVVIE